MDCCDRADCDDDVREEKAEMPTRLLAKSKMAGKIKDSFMVFDGIVLLVRVE
jgi:hypothetical protein